VGRPRPLTGPTRQLHGIRKATSAVWATEALQNEYLITSSTHCNAHQYKPTSDAFRNILPLDLLRRQGMRRSPARLTSNFLKDEWITPDTPSKAPRRLGREASTVELGLQYLLVWSALDPNTATCDDLDSRATWMSAP
jgi:hypothetical protein